MNNAAIASGLLLAVLACALAFLSRRIATASVATAGIFTAAIALTVAPPAIGIALAGCWISLGLGALSVFWPKLARRGWLLPIAFSANSGVWAGLVLADDGGHAALVPALICLTLVVPAAFSVERGWTIAPRIVTSWLLAVALLAGSIPHLIDHPGYVPDHRM